MADTAVLPARVQHPGRHRSSGPGAAQFTIVAALVVIAGSVAHLGSPAWLSTPLTLLATVMVTENLVRYRRRGLLDAVLVGISGVIVVAVLLGLGLNLLPAGLTLHSWTVAGTLTGLVALVASARPNRPAGVWRQYRQATAPAGADRANRTSMLVGVVCSVLAVIVVTGSFVVAAQSTSANQIDPLQISATTTARGIDITLSAGSPEGPYDLVVLANGAAATAASGLELTSTPVTVPVTIPIVGRTLVNLVPTGAALPVRQLIFDSGRLTP